MIPSFLRTPVTAVPIQCGGILKTGGNAIGTDPAIPLGDSVNHHIMTDDGGRENPLKTQHCLYIAIPVRRCGYDPIYPVSEWIVKRLFHVVQLSDKSHPAGNHKAKPGNRTTSSKIFF
jgi:hypothetical protein